MHVHLKTLGCRLNEAELESWSRDFQSQGIQPTAAPEKADLVVVNTCAVTEEAVKKSRKLLRRAQRDNPNAKLVVSGCYVSLNPEQAAADLGVDLVVPNTDKEHLAQIAIRELQLPTMPATAMEPGGYSPLQRNRQRAFIKVQDGCRYRCSYCIVTLARGEEHSRSTADIIDEINTLQAQGIQEVVLAGVHLGGYGSDTGSSLSTLVESVLAHTDMPRVRLGSLEPWDLPEHFWSLFDNPRLMPHLHLPMQSGADTVLRRMSRRCRRDEFLDLAESARLRIPNFNITTDIIVGFPGETDDEWRQTLDFVEQAKFGHVHIFAFSPRSGTKAAMLPNPVSRETKRQRSEQLHALAVRLKQERLQREVGTVAEVLVEGRPEESGNLRLWSGYLPNYLRVHIPSPDNLENRIIRVQVEKPDGEYLLAKPAISVGG
ncbi:tRNA (N(6)-L-threonylcarbamoyladenosine(37)-C(2))-methylthiotransferase MtaB [Thiolapillus brandeum]|uniref:RNA modification enzyme, MiaB family n=1 Tax=Thiolapillus brandeum TaxID=1076588 RepID=A0A7U6GJQ4_9GAMM|nr:tRNA (N(6)-L-threonylcarbamoyladenosine(37)-C(2))-methylthiotransferase MtaB [Thiolapillus brandeum]BAO44882.1 RNA modification enzyme, MiaB family [Thiolapillus brandeum]